MPCPLAAPCSPHSPGLLGEPGPVCVQEVGSGLQGPPVVLREQGPPGRGGVVSVGGVSVLQRGELVLPQHLEGHEVPGRDNSWGPNVLAQRPWSWAGEGQARVTVTKCVWGSVLQAAGQGGPHRHHGGLFLRPQVASSPPFPPATPPELGTPEWGPNTLEPSATLPGNSFPAPGQRQVVAQAQPQGSDCPSSRGSPPGPAPSGLLALRPACSPPPPRPCPAAPWNPPPKRGWEEEQNRERCVLGKREHVKHKLLHLYPVGLERLYWSPLLVHVGDLLHSYMWLQQGLQLPGGPGTRGGNTQFRQDSLEPHPASLLLGPVGDRPQAQSSGPRPLSGRAGRAPAPPAPSPPKRGGSRQATGWRWCRWAKPLHQREGQARVATEPCTSCQGALV